MHLHGETSKHFKIEVDMRQWCVMSPWLFKICMDGVMREMKGKVGEVGVKMDAEGRKWVQNSILFAADTVLTVPPPAPAPTFTAPPSLIPPNIVNSRASQSKSYHCEDLK